ncbi:hypothetical protein K8O68_03895 [Salipaludibacillus sp. CUR1]|uniref:hypothetical protein n=1 Tax=Salipaludibacillus sp. CUR1 TaxID=2820003 RepID=UPI001E4DC4D0|nr:hypothetical protein [Salipaludibacillus sp. CUR1]MCE7791568.1 hypothetical protein [Salipaludibacillus sp. CUR1]
MIETINGQSKGWVAGIARLLRSFPLADELFSRLFFGIMQFFSRPFRAPGKGSTSWCEFHLNRGFCSLPNGRFCSHECSQGTGLNTPCPEGFQPSHSWGYRITGCWCDTFRGSTMICCDCTPVTNSPYIPSWGDCGCMHLLDS